MQNTKHLLTCLGLASLSALAGCSFPGVYKIDIQQGNIVTQDMVDMLQPGMSRSQSRFVMGTPLINDTFHPQRWDYVYTIQPGGGRRQQEGQTLQFNGQEQLSGLSGDFMPGTSRDAAILGSDSGSRLEPPRPSRQAVPSETPAQPGSLEEQIQNEVDSVEVISVPTPEPLETSPQ